MSGGITAVINQLQCVGLMRQRLTSDEGLNGAPPRIGGHGALYNFQFNAGDVNAFFSVLLDNIANVSAYVSCHALA